MTNHVLISITGTQLAAGGPEEVEMMTTGSYFESGGTRYISYDEIVEEGSDAVKNTIRIEPDCMTVVKNGITSAQMVFEKNKKNLACYMTPFGQLMIGIHTGDMRVTEEEDLLRVDVDYSLDINYEHVSDCSVKVEVRPRQA